VSLVKTVTMAIVADAGDSQARLDELAAKQDRLKDPVKMAVVADTGEAQASYDELAVSEDRAAVAAKGAGDASEKASAKTDAGAASSSKAVKHLGLMALAAGGVAVASVHMAMKWDEASTQLVTGAGESDAALAGVKAGMLQISNQTGTSAAQIQAGMFMIESAGFHGAAGLKVLGAAAEGAKVGNADLGTVADATTTVLKDYGLGAGSATAATSGLVAVVSAGKTHMEDLSASVSRVLPTAASLHVSFAEVGGAMATMTSEGTSAKLAAMGLNTTMLNLASGNAVAKKEMHTLGLSSTQVSNTLTHQGLIAALTEVTDAAGKKFPPGSAAYVDALNKMLGGHRGLQVALQITGHHLGTLKSDTKSVGDAMHQSGKDVTGWSHVTGDAQFKADQLKTEIHNTGIALGEVMMPAVMKILGPIDSFAGGILKSKTETDILVGVLGTALAGYAIVKTVQGFKSVTGAISDMGTGISKLLVKLGLQTAATEEATVAQTEADVAMDANPIGLIVLGITALIAVIILIVTHWKEFKKYAVDAWDTVERDGKKAFDWIRGHWPLLLAILTGPVGIAVYEIKGHWHEIVSGAEDAIHGVTSWFSRLPGMLLGYVADFGHLLWNAGVWLLQGLLGGIESEVGAVVGAAENVGSSILGGIKNALGLGSPSRKAREQAQMVGQGLVLGLLDSVPSVDTAAQHLAAATLSGMTGGSARPYGGAPAPAAGTGGAQQVLQVEWVGGAGADAEFITWLKRNIRFRGGDPSVLGR
jgi:TP901 family phage tail tape measure protein